MASIDFPNNPQIDDIHIHEELAWSWDGVSWKRLFEDHNFSSKIGVGTSAPQEEIHIRSVTPVIRIEDIDGGYMQIVGSDGSIRFDADNTNSIADTNVRFIIDGSEKFRIDSDGNVGIGTSSNPYGYRLDVTGGRAIVRGSTEGVLVLDDSGVVDASRPIQYISSDGGYLKLGNANRSSTNGTTNSVNRLIIDPDGNVDIGNSSSNVELKVNDHKVYHEGNLEIDTAIVFSTAMQDTPEQKWVSFTIPHIGGSGTSNYYYFDVYGYSDIGTMDSQLHYRLYIHVRADGTNENAINIKPLLIMDDPLGGDASEERFNFYYTQTSVTDSKVWIHLPEDYSALDILSSKLESGGLSPAISSMFAETSTQPSGLISVPVIESLRTEGGDNPRTYIKGSVGIGTAAPSRVLHVMDGTNDGSGGVKVSSYLPVIELQDMSANAGSSKIQQDQLAMKIGPTTSDTYLVLNTEDTERMRIDKDGNVGIGQSPTNKLSVNGRADFDRIVFTNAYQAGTENWIISTGDTGTIAGSSGYTHNGGIGLFANATYHSSGNFSLQDTSSLSASAISVQEDGHIRFAAVDGLSSTTNVKLLASYTRMTIEPSGKVGIGTQAPLAPLHVVVPSTSAGGTYAGVFENLSSQDSSQHGVKIIVEPTPNTGVGNYPLVISNDGGVTNDCFLITNDGKVGIGTTPSAKLHIEGDKDATNLIIGAPLHTVSGGGLADYSEILFDNNYVTGSSGTAYIRHYANSHQNSEGALYFGITSSTGTTSSALAIRGTGETYSYNDIRISKSFPKLILDSPSTSTTGDDWTTEGAMIVLGESADDGAGTGTAALYLTYNGNGNSYIGTGGVNTSTGVPNQGYIHFPYNLDRINLVADRVGVGTTTPQEQLHVAGNAYITGNADIQGSIDIGSEVVLSESTDRADLLQISSTTSQWGGLQIRNSSGEGRWSFMTDGEHAGIYNDEDNQWHIHMTESAGVRLYYNAVNRLETTSTGVDITGSLTTTGTQYFDFTGGTLMRVGSNSGSDVTLMRVNANSIANDSGDYGFSVKYMGSRANNANSYSIFSDNQASGTQIEAFKINQDGKLYQGGTNEIWHAGNLDASSLGKWDDAATAGGIYRNSRVGIGDFSNTFVGDALHIDMGSDSSNGLIQISSDAQTNTYELGMYLRKTQNNLYDFKVMSHQDMFKLQYRDYSNAFVDAWTFVPPITSQWANGLGVFAGKSSFSEDVVVGDTLGIGTSLPVDSGTPSSTTTRTKLHIDKGSIFINSPWPGSQASPIRSEYWDTFDSSKQNNIDKNVIIFGNPWAYGANNGNNYSWSDIKHRVGVGTYDIKLTTNDGDHIWNEDTNSWNGPYYDNPAIGSTWLSLWMHDDDNAAFFRVGTKYASNTYTGDATIQGDAFQVYQNGFTRSYGAIKIGERVAEPFDTNDAKGCIRYNSTTDDFEGNVTGYPNGWTSLTGGIGSLVLFPTPVVFKNRDGVTTLADLPIVKKSDGVTNSVWRRLSYSAVSSEIPAGSVLFCRVMGASGGYTSNSQFYINNDVSGSSDEAIDWWEHAWMINYDAGATAGGGNFSGYSNHVQDGYFLPNEGVNSSTDSVLISYYGGVQKILVLGYVRMF